MRNLKKGFTLSKSKGFTLTELPVVRKRAFTLIELLVVIAIIGILATVVILNVASAREKSQTVAALQEMNDANKSANSCAFDGGTVNAGSTGATICGGTGGGLGGVWPTLSAAKHGTWIYSTTLTMNKAATAAGATDWRAKLNAKTAVDTATEAKIVCVTGGCTTGTN